MIEWPKELPYPDLSGYALEDAPNVSRTEMASGRARQRQMYTSVPSFVTLSWGMDQRQFEFFAAWVRWKLKDCTEWFTGWAQTAGPARQTEMRFVGSSSAPPYRARMDGPDYWRISARIEIRERQTLPKGWEDMASWIFMADLFDIAMNREWPEA
ncbi:hypothetical protein [Pseudomonas sp.]|uniref:hypothetical protein n=1 Tax=Pseudomonas sp. TaxID=306 RepID=UPI001A015F88|nr:hypothetical protein [Pseudomonas sp.]MBF0675595.1 hypothetical protein [Pseudomonas sp.]